MAINVLSIGIKPTMAKLELMGERVVENITVMERIAADMMRATESLIHSHGRRGGGSWARLKPDTVRKKGDTRILYTSGARPGYTQFGDNTLVRSVTEPNAPYQILNVRNSFIEFGTDRPWAEVVARGSSKEYPC